MARFASFHLVLLLVSAALVSLAHAAFSGTKFCDEKYFDNMFQDKQYVYLNVFDAHHKENRFYRWVYGSSEVDQFVTMNVGEDFKIPQTGFFSSHFDGLTVNTYYQPKESGKDSVTICGRYGPEKRIRYNATDPFPMFPLCGCSQMGPHLAEYKCRATILKERFDAYMNKHPWTVFPYMITEDNSLNNKYRSLYYQDGNAALKTNNRLYVFKRYDQREIAVLDDFFSTNPQKKIYRLPIDYEVVGLVSIYRGGINATVRYLLEEVAISEIGYIAQYIWEADMSAANMSISLKNRVHWREFFGCHSSTALPLFTMLGVLLFTIFVVVAVILSVMYFYFDYDLLLMKAKHTNLSYYLS